MRKGVGKKNNDQNNSIQAIWPLKTTKWQPSDISTRNFQMEPVKGLGFQGEKKNTTDRPKITNSWVPAVDFAGGISPNDWNINMMKWKCLLTIDFPKKGVIRSLFPNLRGLVRVDQSLQAAMAGMAQHPRSLWSSRRWKHPWKEYLEAVFDCRIRVIVFIWSNEQMYGLGGSFNYFGNFHPDPWGR